MMPSLYCKWGKKLFIHSFKLPDTLHKKFMNVAMYTHYLPQEKKKKLYASQTKSIIKAGIFPSVYDEKPRLFIKTAQRESIMTTPNQVSRQRLNSPKYRMGHSSFRFYTKLQRDELWWTENPGCSWSSVAVIYVYIYIDSMLPINHIKANSDHYKLKLYHNWLIKKKKKIHKQ